MNNPKFEAIAIGGNVTVKSVLQGELQGKREKEMRCDERDNIDLQHIFTLSVI